MLSVGPRVCGSEIKSMASPQKYKDMLTFGKFDALNRVTKGLTTNIYQVVRIFNLLK